MSANEFRFVGQVMYRPDARGTATGKAVCTLKVCQREKAPKTEKGYYERWLEVDLWEHDAEKAAGLNVGAWVEVTGKLHCGEKEMYEPAAKARVRVRGVISAQLPNVRVLEDADEIAEALEELVPIQAREPRNDRQAPRAGPQRPRPGPPANGPRLAGDFSADFERDGDIPF